MVTLTGVDAAGEVLNPTAIKKIEKKKKPESLAITSSVSLIPGMHLRLKKLFDDVKRELRTKWGDAAGGACRSSNGSFRIEYLLRLIFEFFRNFYPLLRKVWRIGFAAWDAGLL